MSIQLRIVLCNGVAIERINATDPRYDGGLLRSYNLEQS
jgi:hypothetical protein